MMHGQTQIRRNLYISLNETKTDFERKTR